MIDFIKQGEDLIMRYNPERGSDDWLVNPLESDDMLRRLKTIRDQFIVGASA